MDTSFIPSPRASERWQKTSSKDDIYVGKMTSVSMEDVAQRLQAQRRFPHQDIGENCGLLPDAL